MEEVYKFSKEQDVAAIVGKTILDCKKYEQSEFYRMIPEAKGHTFHARMKKYDLLTRKT